MVMCLHCHPDGSWQLISRALGGATKNMEAWTMCRHWSWQKSYLRLLSLRVMLGAKIGIIVEEYNLQLIANTNYEVESLAGDHGAMNPSLQIALLNAVCLLWWSHCKPCEALGPCLGP